MVLSALAEKHADRQDVDNAGKNAPSRPIWLCADDYGISPSVSRAIRDLVMRGRINATSVMVAAPSFDRAEAASLNMLNAGTRRVAIGLHVTITAPFRPLSADFRPLQQGAFLPLDKMFLRGVLRALARERLAAEAAAQLQSFISYFGRTPDFIDGHQHVHLFPQVREALLGVIKQAAPNAWVRQCGRALPLTQRFADRKSLVLDALSRRFRARAAAHGIATNPAFAGAYDFASAEEGDFARLFPNFLRGLPPHSVVMCHPGFVDAELERLDPLTHQREREYAFLAAEGFPDMLRAHNVALA
jgi:predicted glycoside hydrolase/deacetylase ChbG (UPF0249 family)